MLRFLAASKPTLSNHFNLCSLYTATKVSTKRRQIHDQGCFPTVFHPYSNFILPARLFTGLNRAQYLQRPDSSMHSEWQNPVMTHWYNRERHFRLWYLQYDYFVLHDTLNRRRCYTLALRPPSIYCSLRDTHPRIIGWTGMVLFTGFVGIRDPSLRFGPESMTFW